MRCLQRRVDGHPRRGGAGQGGRQPARFPGGPGCPVTLAPVPLVGVPEGSRGHHRTHRRRRTGADPVVRRGQHHPRTGRDGDVRHVFAGRPKRDIIAALCDKADYVLAMGTCAAFGGIPAAPPNPTESSGLQFTQRPAGGLFGAGVALARWNPVLNLAGCPVDAATMIETMRWSLTADRSSWTGTGPPPLRPLPLGAVAKKEMRHGRRGWGIPATAASAPSSRRPRRLFRQVIPRPCPGPSGDAIPTTGGRRHRVMSGANDRMEMNRVEGDVEIRLEVEGHTVVDAWCVGTTYRGLSRSCSGAIPRTCW